MEVVRINGRECDTAYSERKSWSGAYTCCGLRSVLMTQGDAWWLTKAQLHCALKRVCWIQPVGFSFCTVLRWDLADLRLRHSKCLIVPAVFYFGVCGPDTRTVREAGQDWLGLLQPSTLCPDLPICGMGLMCSNYTAGTRCCKTWLTSHIWGMSDVQRGVHALWGSSSRNSTHKQTVAD